MDLYKRGHIAQKGEINKEADPHTPMCSLATMLSTTDLTMQQFKAISDQGPGVNVSVDVVGLCIRSDQITDYKKSEMQENVRISFGHIII